LKAPIGKLPVTFPKVVGQIPIYYNHKNTGRPPRPESWVHIDDIPAHAEQTTLGNESHYLDAGFEPQFPFGYGLSYTALEYRNLHLSSKSLGWNEVLTVSAEIANSGPFETVEVVQLYIRDLVGTVTRPVRQLKAFKRVHLRPGERKSVTFELRAEDLAFYDSSMKLVTQPGEFHVWIAPNSGSGLRGELELLNQSGRKE
jgi:beta-glucosidase